MDRLKLMETFAAVALRGSLTAAAAAEGVAPAVVSRRLDALEEYLGVKLLVRTTRKVTLSFEGSAYLEDCQRILREVGDVEAAVSLGGVKARGHLRISAPARLCLSSCPGLPPCRGRRRRLPWPCRAIPAPRSRRPPGTPRRRRLC